MATRLLNAYSRFVKRRPYVGPILTAGVLTTAGDVVAQKIENRPTGYDFKRTVVMSTCGLFYFGPIVTVWLRVLKRLNLSIISTVALDQGIAGPIITGGFIFVHPILSGRKLDEALSILQSSFFSTMKAGWLLWTPAQTINFKFVPFEYRMLFIQTVALLWNTFLSYRSNASLTKEPSLKDQQLT